MPSAAPSRAAFKPGQSAPVSGIYRASHGDSHRAAHDITMKKGELFPRCNTCGEKVRFRLKVRGGNSSAAH